MKNRWVKYDYGISILEQQKSNSFIIAEQLDNLNNSTFSSRLWLQEIILNIYAFNSDY